MLTSVTTFGGTLQEREAIHTGLLLCVLTYSEEALYISVTMVTEVRTSLISRKTAERRTPKLGVRPLIKVYLKI
jgi:hypothetical protein